MARRKVASKKATGATTTNTRGGRTKRAAVVPSDSETEQKPRKKARKVDLLDEDPEAVSEKTVGLRSRRRRGVEKVVSYEEDTDSTAPQDESDEDDSSVESLGRSSKTKKKKTTKSPKKKTAATKKRKTTAGKAKQTNQNNEENEEAVSEVLYESFRKAASRSLEELDHQGNDWRVAGAIDY